MTCKDNYFSASVHCPVNGARERAKHGITNEGFPQSDPSDPVKIDSSCENQGSSKSDGNVHNCLEGVKEREPVHFKDLWRFGWILRISFLCLLRSKRFILLTVLSAVIMALSAMGVSYLSGSISPSEINFIRMLMQLICCSPLVVYKKISVNYSWTTYALLLLRSLMGTVASSLTYLTYQIMPVGNAKAIQYTVPIFAALFGCILLNEKCALADIMLSLLTLSGVVLVAQPSFLSNTTEICRTSYELRSRRRHNKRTSCCFERAVSNHLAQIGYAWSFFSRRTFRVFHRRDVLYSTDDFRL